MVDCVMSVISQVEILGKEQKCESMTFVQFCEYACELVGITIKFITPIVQGQGTVHIVNRYGRNYIVSVVQSSAKETIFWMAFAMLAAEEDCNCEMLNDMNEDKKKLLLLIEHSKHEYLFDLLYRYANRQNK